MIEEVKKAGRALEELVSHLERALAANEAATIKSPAMLADKVTGNPREFDVVVTITSSHHTLVTAIECRDWARPLDVVHIEAYETKCSHCDIHSKIIVSPSGFTEAANKKGAFLGIRCLTLQDIGNIAWIKTPDVELTWRHWLTTDWLIDVIDPSRELAGVKGDQLELRFNDGKPFDQQYLDSMLSEAINSRKRPSRAVGEEWGEHYEFSTHKVCVRHRRTGRRYNCAISADVTLKVESRRERFEMFEYDEPGGKQIARGAIADISAPGASVPAKVVLLEKPDGSRRMVLINASIESGTMLVEKEDNGDGKKDPTS